MEKERDPDALDEDIITKINKEVAMKKSGKLEDTSIIQKPRKIKAPAVALNSVIAATTQATVGTEDTDWKNQVFISKQKTVRVGGPPKGPPPTMKRPGAPPRGPPPAQKKGAAGATAKGADASAGKGGAAANSNIPQAPPIGHFMAYLKGTYDPANPPSADGAAMAPPVDDLNFKPSDAIAGDEMNLEEVDDMAGMIDAIGGDDGPSVERSSIKLVVTDGTVELTKA